MNKHLPEQIQKMKETIKIHEAKPPRKDLGDKTASDTTEHTAKNGDDEFESVEEKKRE